MDTNYDVPMTTGQMKRLYEAECLLGDAAAILGSLADDGSIYPLNLETIVSAHDEAYSAMVSLANMRCALEEAALPKLGAKCV